MKTKITWEWLVEIEPDLLVLEEAIKRLTENPPPDFRAHDFWYGQGKRWGGGLKAWANSLVGFYAKKEELQACEAHNVGISHLYDLLCSIPDAKDEEYDFE